MAHPGYIDTTVYTIVVSQKDITQIKNTMKQVKVEGTHIYLHKITPSPINTTRARRTLSHVKHEKTKLKKKANIRLSVEDLLMLEENKPIQVSCFKLIKE